MNPSSSSNQQQAPHHRRRISEPPDVSGRRRRIMLSKTQSRSTRDLVTAVASTSTATTASTTIGQEQYPPAGRSSRSSSIVDVSLFQDSWTNASFSDHHNTNTTSNSNNNSMSSSWGGGADDGTTNPSLTNHNNNINSTATTPDTTTAVAPALSPSAIHDAARITDWDTVLELCHSHPHLASYRGSVGYTALHHACNRRCPRSDVVRALLQASCQSLYQQEDEKGWLPLHFACRFKMPRPAVQLLLEYEEAAGKWTVSKRDRLGRTPLFYAIRYDAPAGVVELLLQHDPAVILAVDDNDDSPLKLVWDAWADKLQGKRVVHSFLPGGFECKDDNAAAALSVHERARLLRERLPAEHKLQQKWQKANLLLQAAFGFPVAENAVSENDDDDGDNNQDDSKGNDLKEQTLVEMTSATSDDNDDDNSKKRKWRIVHATAAVKCHLSLFLLACALYPEQAAELDENDLRRDACSSTASATRPPHQTALHLAASSNADGEAGKAVILTLLSLHREAAEVQDGIDGSLPLHRMVENERKRDWPQHAAILYHFYPRAVQVADFNGRLPLHRSAAAMTPQAASSSSSAQHHDANAPARGEQEPDEDMSEERSVIIQLVRAFPQAASRADSVGYFPLHLAAQNAAAWDENLQAIYNAHRAAVLARAGPDGRLALHMAAANPKAEASLIERLLELHPRAASMPDRHGNLPLHLACELGQDWQIVCLLYEAFPAAIQQARGEGWLPLHMACAADDKDAADNDLIAQLVAVYPAAASIPDRHGRYPLHLACDSGKSWKRGGLEALVLSDAEVTSTPDAAGRVPFHVAAFKFASPDHGDPESAVTTFLPPWLKNQKNDCEKQTKELDILYELLRADPTVL